MQTICIATVEEHKVTSRDSIASLAKANGMTWQELSVFNWGTDVPEEINKHLRDEVGCTYKVDPYNYRFDDSDTPGIVCIPHPWSTSLKTEKLHTVRVSGASTVAQPRIFFAIYYTKPGDDGAFQRAAETWRREVESRKSFRSGVDLFLMESVTYEADFRNAWQMISLRSTIAGAEVVEGHVFSHASLDLPTHGEEGLEFAAQEPGDDSTITIDDIWQLEELNWAGDEGLLVLHGCNTARKDWHPGGRQWAPAEEFAKRQQVRTTGQMGWAYMSSNSESYVEISNQDSQVYLWAYRHGRNVPYWVYLPDGSKIDGATYEP